MAPNQDVVELTTLGGYDEAVHEVRMTINFEIRGHSEEFVQVLLNSGRYSSATDVVSTALRLMEERDQLLAIHKDALAQKIEAGYQSLQEGRHCDGEAFFATLESELDEIDRQVK